MKLFKKLFLESSSEAVRRFSQKKVIIDEIKKSRFNGLAYDAGCGAGLYTLSLAGIFNNIVAVDLYKKHARLLKEIVKSKNIKNILVFKGNVETFVYSKKYDFILATEVIEHLYSPTKCLKTFYKGLRKGGSLLISVPYSSKKPGVSKKIHRYSEDLYESHKVEGYNESTIKALVAKSGFTVKKVFYTMGFFSKLALMLAKYKAPNIIIAPLALIDYLSCQFVKKLSPIDIAVICEK